MKKNSTQPKIPETDLILNKDGSVFHLNLKPGNIANIILAVGDAGMVHTISQHFDRIEFEMNKREFSTHTGTYKGVRLSAASTGVGTDNIEIFYNELDALVNIDLKKRVVKQDKTKLKIIRMGTSSCLQEDIRIGSVILAEYGIGLDNIFNFYELPQSALEKQIITAIKDNLNLPFLPYCVSSSELLRPYFSDNVIKGNSVSCPGFYGPQGRKLRLPLKHENLLDDLTFLHLDDFWLTDIDMETAGHYAMARLLGHEVISLNIVTANRVKSKLSKDPNKLRNELIERVLQQVIQINGPEIVH